MRYLKFTLLVLLTIGLFTGCPKKQTVKPVEEVQVPIEKPPEVIKPKLVLNRIFFDFDKSDIRQDAAIILGQNYEMMKSNPEVNIIIEGHCCELGTSEYNLVLGERRAKSAKSYLNKLGIGSDRMSIISYGEERPLDPNDLPKNRRCEFVKQ